MRPVDSGRCAIQDTLTPPALKYRRTMAKNERGRQGRSGTPGARGPRGARGTTGATGPRGCIGKAGPKGLQGLRGALHERDMLESVATHFEDVYRQLTALQKRIDQLQPRLPATTGVMSKNNE